VDNTVIEFDEARMTDEQKIIYDLESRKPTALAVGCFMGSLCEPANLQG
jgi:hypothetical protein